MIVLPGVPQAPVERVVVPGQGLEAGLAGQRPGHLVGERGTRPLDHPAGGGHRGDEAPVQAEPAGLAGLQCAAQEQPGAGEDGLPGAGGHDRRLAVDAPGSQRGQPVELALPLVGGELVHVPGGEDPGVVAAARGGELQECAQLQPGAPGVVEGAAGPRAGRGPQDVGEVVPGKVAQPPLGDPVQVDAPGAVAELAPEVLGEDVAGLAGLCGRDVEGVQAAGDGGGDAGALPAGRLAQAGILGGQVGEGAQAAIAAVVSKALDRGQLPLPVLPPGVPAHAPLDLGPQQRVQAPEVDLVGPQHCRGRPAPPAEGWLVCVLDGDGPPGALVAVAPLAGQGSASWAALPLVAGVVPRAQPQRRERLLRADADEAAPVAGGRLLPGQPPVEVGGVAVPGAVVIPAELVVVTQPQRQVAGWPVRADPAWLLLDPVTWPEGLGRLQEAGPCPALVAVPAPERLVGAAKVAVPHHGPLASCQAVPPVDGVPGGDLDDVRPEQRVEGRRADQRSQDLQPVPALACTGLRQQREGHLASPQTVRRAASNAGSWMSTWP